MQRLQYLFQSMAEANFNAIRVWGGGRYESDEFYELADMYGILVWQDFMFACSLYPTDTKFLANVQSEIEYQIYEIRNHPSILIYSANNENEKGIYEGWFYENNYRKEEIILHYIKFYRDTIEPIVQRSDSTRPFVFTSPSNGILSYEKIKNGTLSDNPDNELYGDIHFYDETVNLWNSSNFKIPRCATEFGVQSFPLSNTLRSWVDPNEFWYGSESVTSRQHHPGGVLTLLYMIADHFDVSINMTADGANFEEIILATQMHQAIALQSQVEHYRRWRGIVGPDGRGNTMCAMFWQLNDIWAAPSWSSIDFDLRWKPAHYFAKRFFQPLLFSMYLDDDRENFNAFVVSDLITALYNVQVTLSVTVVGNGDFSPIYTTTIRLNQIEPLKSQRLNFNFNLKKLMSTVEKTKNYRITSDDFIFRIDAISQSLDSNNTTVLTNGGSILLPNFIRSCRVEYDICVDGTASIRSVRHLGNDKFEIEIVATDGVVPIVWIEFLRGSSSQKQIFNNSDDKILYHFSDNAFSMTEAKRIIKFYTNSQSNITAADFTLDVFPRQKAK